MPHGAPCGGPAIMACNPAWWGRRPRLPAQIWSTRSRDGSATMTTSLRIFPLSGVTPNSGCDRFSLGWLGWLPLVWHNLSLRNAQGRL